MDKDQSFDELLRQTMSLGEKPAVSSPCLDAERLAAWNGNSLSLPERAAAEMHLAECDRCLAVLAAIAKTDPPPSVAPSRWFSVRWLVPATTAAVAVSAWVLLQQPPRSAPVGVPPAPATAPPAAAAAQDAFKSARPTERDRTAAPDTAVDAPRDRAGAPAPAVLQRPNPELKARAPADSVRKDATRQSTAATADAPRAPAAAPAPPARAEAAESRAFAVAQEKSDERPIVRSPDGVSQWRVDGAAVERSLDHGRTWRAQAIGSTADLLAGASPAPAVCWIVGRKGTVLLTVDGASWRLIQFPDAGSDLIAVTARSAAEATVTTASGSTYRTTDAGRTWTLQENPAAPF